MAGPGQAVNSSRLSQVWETTKAKGAAFRDKSVKVVTSDKFLIAIVVIGAVGALAAGAGATSMLGHFHQLNALGHYAVAMVAAGGVASVLGTVCLGILIKHVVDNRKARKAAEKAIDNKLVEDRSAVNHANRMESIKRLPKQYQATAHKLQPGYYAVVPSTTKGQYAVLTAEEQVIDIAEEKISKEELQGIKAAYNKTYKWMP